jgi:hypothetical protein
VEVEKNILKHRKTATMVWKCKEKTDCHGKFLNGNQRKSEERKDPERDG